MIENSFQTYAAGGADGYGQVSTLAGKPTLLLTNDDGYQAAGLQALVGALRGVGRIVVCAPDAPRSGFSSSFTCTRPVTLTRVSDDGEVAVYACSGTPVDCVKLALHRLLFSHRPDMILSGINHGGNYSICVMYSGTMGAVLEACAVGIPSMGLSLLDHHSTADFSHALPIARRLTENLLAHPMPRGVTLNVNIPSGITPRGLRLCRQADGYWEKEFHYLSGHEEQGAAVFQVIGTFVNNEPEATDTDLYYLAQGYATLVPTTVDQTHYRHFEQFRTLETLF